MAAFSAPFGAGIAYGGVVPSAGLNAINTDLPKAPNFVDGGATYNPLAALTVGGAGIYISSTNWRLLSGAVVNNYGSSFVGQTGVAGITATGGSSGGHGVQAQGGAGGTGITATGGNLASGGVFAGGIGGANGLSSTATGNGSGAVLTGSGTGAGVTATGGTTGKGIVCDGGGAAYVAIDIGVGNAQFTGAQPVATADPGMDQYLCATNVCKAWAMIQVSGGAATLLDGYNIASVAVVGTTHVLVTFARPFASVNYCPTVSNCDHTANTPNTDFTTRAENTIRINWRDDTGAAVDPSVTTLRVALQVMGRQ